MAGISVTVELNHRPAADGTHRIFIRLCQNRKYRRVATEYSIPPEFWNPDKKEVRRSHPLSETINLALQAQRNEIQNGIAVKRVMKKPVSAAEIQRQAKKQIAGDSFFDWADRYLAKVPNPTTRDKNQSVVNKLRTYLGEGRDLVFPEITYEFLRDYQRYLRHTLGNAQSTATKNIEILRILFNEAVDSDVYDPPKDPFRKLKLTRPKSKPRTKLTRADVAAIEALDYGPGHPCYHARNLFLLLYFARGMRIRDGLQLKWLHVKGDRIRYVMSKTVGRNDREIDLKITEPIRAILARYRSEHVRPRDYVFPMLGLNKRKLEHHKLVESWTAEVNKRLAQVAADAGIDKHVTSHVARHSFIETMRQETNNDVYAVSQSAGHSSIGITEGYFAREEQSPDADRLSDLAARPI